MGSSRAGTTFEADFSLQLPFRPGAIKKVQMTDIGDHKNMYMEEPYEDGEHPSDLPILPIILAVGLIVLVAFLVK